MQEAIEDHYKKLVYLLQRCSQKEVKINKDKFKLKLTEFPYVGYVLAKDGLKPDPRSNPRTESPIDVKGVQLLLA